MAKRMTIQVESRLGANTTDPADAADAGALLLMVAQGSRDHHLLGRLSAYGILVVDDAGGAKGA